MRADNILILAWEVQLAFKIHCELIYEHQTLLQPTPTRRADSFDNYRGTFYSFNACTGSRNVTLEIWKVFLGWY